MTAHGEARRRVISDALAIDDEAASATRRAARGDRVRRATNAAVVAATTSAVTVGPAIRAAAEEPSRSDAVAELGGTPVNRVAAPPVPDVADLIVASVLAESHGTTGPLPAEPAMPQTQPETQPEPDPGPVTEGPATEGPATEGVPGLDPVVVIPLDGRETMPPPRQTPPVGGGVVLPNVQPGSPASDRLPPAPAEPEGEPTTPLPPRPTVDVIVGAPPAPQPAGGGASDLSQDFTDPNIGGDVVTTPLPLEGTTTYVVVAGDSLWSIATELLAAADDTVTTSEIDAAVRVIYAANREVIGPNPDLLAIGVVLEIPESLDATEDVASTGDDAG